MAGSNRPELARLKEAYRRNPTLFSFPENKTGHSILFTFKEYSYQGYVRNANNPSYFQTRQRAVGRSLSDRANAISTSISGFGSVELPFPRQLTDNTSVRLNAFEREAVTEAVVNAIGSTGVGGGNLGDLRGQIFGAASNIAGSIRDAGAAFANGGVEGATNIIGNALTNFAGIEQAHAGRVAAYLMRNTIGKLGGDISRTIDMVTGATVNPKEALAFEGIDLRTYGFTWELYPSNQTETETIDKIIKLCKRNALPETQDLIPGVFEQTFLKYPSTVEIRLIGTNPKYFPKFKPCMIKSVNVNYENAAGTVPIMQGGVPGSVILSMELQEMSAHTREDVDFEVGQATPTSGSTFQVSGE
jgi:hypothetical protein